MFGQRWILVGTLCTWIAVAASARGAAPDPGMSTVSVTLTQTYPATGCYNPGLPKKTVTIAPGGAESLAQNGITIEVIVRDAAGNGCPNIPRSDIRVDHPNLTWCSGGNYADAPTDNSGRTTFTGFLCGGGCAPELNVYVGNLLLGTAQVETNSPDFAHQGTSPGFVDISDLVAFGVHLGASNCGGGSNQYTICADYNEDGRIDASDLAYWVVYYGVNCFVGCP